MFSCPECFCGWVYADVVEPNVYYCPLCDYRVRVLDDKNESLGDYNLNNYSEVDD